MSRLVHSESLHVGCMRLPPGGLVGSHRAATDQMFAAVEGEGWVRGSASERIPIEAGQAVFWESGEEHEAGTDTGLVAIVVEGEGLETNPEDMGPVTISQKLSPHTSHDSNTSPDVIEGIEVPNGRSCQHWRERKAGLQIITARGVVDVCDELPAWGRS